MPFEKYARCGAKPGRARLRPPGRSNNGAPNIERADKLVQLIAKQKGLDLPGDRCPGWRWSISGWRRIVKGSLNFLT